MAISRDKKQVLVDEMSKLLADSKMTVFAKYQGLSVADIQKLRQAAREQNVTIKVIKNRLVKVAVSNNEYLKDADTSALKDQLLYAISLDDEVAPAQVLHNFAKEHTELEFAGAFSAEGNTLSVDEVKELAGLPSKDQLVAQVVEQLISPINDITNALSGNLHGLLDGIETKATN